MKRHLLAILATIILSLTGSLTAFGVAYAACPGGSTSQGQVLAGIDETGNGCDASGVSKAVNAAVQVLSFLAGMAAVIMIIISGFKYITSAGDTNKVASAKNTLVYALVGIAIAALAQFLVHFVLNAANHP